MNVKFLLSFLLFKVTFSCSGQGFVSRKPIRIEGATMGTTYHVTYFDKQNRNFKQSIDSLLKVVNQSINNYDPQSEVSKFNRVPNAYRFQLPHFYQPLKTAKEVYNETNGGFDLTVMPLVNAWGFGQEEIAGIDSSKIDSLKNSIGFDKIIFSNDSIYKKDPRIQIDFGGIGQGYGVDVIVEFLKKKGIKNMLVELGGEGMAVGINLEKKSEWEIGILDPNSDHAHQFLKARVKVKDKSFTTSGSYTNYREINGVKYSHIIDPVSGYPINHRLLSVSIFAKDAATADAWDTALMVLGVEKSIDLLKKHNELDGFLIFSDESGKQQTYTTQGIKPFLTLMPKQ